MTSTILEGSYVIQSAAFSRPFIGRNVIETPLPSPKAIFSLPLDVAFLQVSRSSHLLMSSERPLIFMRL